MKKPIIIITVLVMLFFAGCKSGPSSSGGPRVAVRLIECAGSDISLNMTASMTPVDNGYTVTVNGIARCGNVGIKNAPIDVEFWWGEAEYGTSDENGRFSVQKTTTEPLPDQPMVTVTLSDAKSNMIRLKSISVAAE